MYAAGAAEWGWQWWDQMLSLSDVKAGSQQLYLKLIRGGCRAEDTPMH